MTIIYPSPIFGPVHSRRLGLSLGINLLPDDGKICNFDCVYCECGLNAERRAKHKMPTREEVRRGLEERLRQMRREGRMPDVLTFAGNGEPTCHRDFAGIIDDTLALRDNYCPEARVSVLSNGTNLHLTSVFEALKRVDNNIQKLDTVDMEYIKKVNRPADSNYSPDAVVDNLRKFQGRVIVQTMFMTGGDYDNTSERYVKPWLEAVRLIAPQRVMVYTIDRETPVTTLRKATPETLDSIAAQVRAAGIDVTVSY